MMMAAHLRELHQENAARVLLTEVADQTQIIGWSMVAKQELAVLEGLESSLKSHVVAVKTMELPTLDGQQDEPMWAQADPIRLISLGQEPEMPSEVRFCYDDEYIYIAILCPKNGSQLAVAPSKNRGYDADLRAFDRIELSLDTDRDYCSGIDFSVAENGLTSDRCCGNHSFNPKWHVGVQSRQDAWRAEIAIPLDQLASSLIDDKARWAISARRVRPNGTIQSWSQLRTHLKLPEASGLLIFE